MQIDRHTYKWCLQFMLWESRPFHGLPSIFISSSLSLFSLLLQRVYHHDPVIYSNHSMRSTRINLDSNTLRCVGRYSLPWMGGYYLEWIWWWWMTLLLSSNNMSSVRCTSFHHCNRISFLVLKMARYSVDFAGIKFHWIDAKLSLIDQC